MNNANTHMPQNLFDALARYDLEGMVCLYAFHTRNAIQSVASVNKDIKYRSLWKLRPGKFLMRGLELGCSHRNVFVTR